MKEQDIEFIMTSKDSMIRNKLFMATSCWNAHGEVCARHQASHMGCYSIATEIEEIATPRRCTHPTWMKNTLKGSDVPRGVPTSNYDSSRRIRIFT